MNYLSGYHLDLGMKNLHDDVFAKALACRDKDRLQQATVEDQ